VIPSLHPLSLHSIWCEISECLLGVMLMRVCSFFCWSTQSLLTKNF
jgi:hypothetical protein